MDTQGNMMGWFVDWRINHINNNNNTSNNNISNNNNINSNNNISHNKIVF